VTDSVQVVSIGVSLALLAIVLELVRRRRLTEEYSLVWIGCALVLLGAAVWRTGLDLAAVALGIHYPPALLILALALFVFVICLSFSLVISRQREQIERLVEDIALLEADVRELRERIGPVPSGEMVANAAPHRREPAAPRRPA
jgi:hypothetical protein